MAAKASIFYHWFIKYKVYHLAFWFAYHYMWWAFQSGNPWEAANNIFYSPYAVKFAFYVIFQALGVYFNLYFLIPKVLQKGRYVAYVSFLILTILATAAFILSGYHLTAFIQNQPFQDLFGMAASESFTLFKTATFPSTAASMTLAMSIKLTKHWLEAQRRQQFLEKEKLETELKFLKSQFNPHFLFNTINSIFVLIHKNPGMASDSLAKFSDLLRYQLYECNEHLIPLDRELSFLENFIELEKLRQEKYLQIDAQMELSNAGNLMIAPFLLMPFVENAFKHVSQHRDQDNWIKINLTLEHKTLRFTIRNSFSKTISPANEIMEVNGIGLKNVQRRLDLIYPDSYDLSINKKDQEFSVALSLELEE